MRIESSSNMSHDVTEENQQGSASPPFGAVRTAPMRDAMLMQLPRRGDAMAHTTTPQSESRAKSKRTLEATSDVLGSSTAKRSRIDPPSGFGTTLVPRVQSAQFQPSRPQAGIAMSDPPKVIRRNLTAEIVHQILAERAAGMRSREVAQVLRISRASAVEWSSQAYWESERLAERLARMGDYASFREKLTVLAKGLGLTTGDLPPPAESGKLMDASGLTKALREVIKIQARGGTGRGKGRNVMDMAGQAAGCSGIKYWLKTDGALRTSVSAVARLIGYREQREELRRLFASLGHMQTAESLPEPGENESIKKITTASLVEALTMLAANRGMLLSKISITLGLDSKLLREYGIRNDGSFRDFDMLQKLPDYAQHREALSAALLALDHSEQANGLPSATIDATRLLQSLRSDFDQFASAVMAMQRNSMLSAPDAALQAGVPPAALAAMIERGGIMRERGAIHAVLTRFHGYLARGIDDELDRLHALVLGKTPMTAPATAMAAKVFPRQAREPEKVFIVPSSTADPGVGMPNRLKILYADNPDLVAEPSVLSQKFADKIARYLRVCRQPILSM